MGIFNEILDSNGHPKEAFKAIYSYFTSLSVSELRSKQQSLEKVMYDLGITFNVYTEDRGIERIIPFDLIPRIIENKEWEYLEIGIKQRIHALNLFLQDIYSEQKILKDNVIPKETVLSSKGFLAQCMGLKPAKGIYVHISGIDLIRDEGGQYRVLEDNLRCPSGVSYMIQNRELSKQHLGEILRNSDVKSIHHYPEKLLECLRYLSNKETVNVAVLTPGIYNSAYYEHSFLAQQMGVDLVENKDITIKQDGVFYNTIHGLKPLDVIYRRIDDTFMDPNVFNPDSLLGVKNIFKSYAQNQVCIANALGTGVADDKVMYSYVPKIIKYYLGEDALLPNVDTYLCENDSERAFVLDNLEKLVVKEANEAGGYGMLIGPKANKDEIDLFRRKIVQNPRNYIAQPTISLSESPCFIQDKLVSRHIDLRPYVLYGKDIYITPGGLTRVALKEGSLVVNSSQGGGSKDTWVLNA
ncbi:MAG: circularly permuted type 2 ATP-grasp protein [Leadbetterella sp.]